jgi:hypothetical protein
MTAPRGPQWPLAPALRLTALAMILAVAALMVGSGILSIVLWVAAAVTVVLAAIRLRANWGKRGQSRP